MTEYQRENDCLSGCQKWQLPLCKCLEDHRTHIAFIFLLMVDFACVIAELAITLTSCEPDHDNPIIHVLEWVSLSIVSIFLLELILKCVCFGWSYFHRNWLHIFDAVVIVVTFVLMVALFGSKPESLAGLPIVFRIFYIFRLIDSAATTTAMQYEATIQRLEAEIEEYRKKQVPQSDHQEPI